MNEGLKVRRKQRRARKGGTQEEDRDMDGRGKEAREEGTKGWKVKKKK